MKPGEEKADVYNTPVFSSLGKQQAHGVLFFNENKVCTISLGNRR